MARIVDCGAERADGASVDRRSLDDELGDEPGLQRIYAEWAQHYDTVIIPARPQAPRDKAKVETGVLVADALPPTESRVSFAAVLADV